MTSKEALERINNAQEDLINALHVRKNELKEENTKLKQAIKVLKDNYPIQFKESCNCNPNVINYSVIVGGTLRCLEREEYELLKEVLRND